MSELAENERDRIILGWNPFEGDRDSNVAVLSKRMVVTRRAHRCQHCWGEIPPGQRCRVQRERDDDDHQFGAFYFCSDCCAAIIATMTGVDYEALDDRFMINHSEEKSSV